MTALGGAATLLPLLLALPVGSFAGLLADRLPRGEPVLAGRSSCRSCGAVLGVPDLVPVLSWLLLRGRCRHCAAPIGADPLAVEMAALGLAAAAVSVLPETLVWPGCMLGWLLLALGLADLRHMLLPDALTLPLGLLGVTLALVGGPVGVAASLIGAGVGFAVLGSVMLGHRHLRGFDGMGLGDVKLLAAGGTWVGWQGLPMVVLVATLGTLLVALVTTRCRVGRDLAVPFGPGLASGIWVSFVLQA